MSISLPAFPRTACPVRRAASSGPPGSCRRRHRTAGRPISLPPAIPASATYSASPFRGGNCCTSTQALRAGRESPLPYYGCQSHKGIPLPHLRLPVEQRQAGRLAAALTLHVAVVHQAVIHFPRRAFVAFLLKWSLAVGRNPSHKTHALVRLQVQLRNLRPHDEPDVVSHYLAAEVTHIHKQRGFVVDIPAPPSIAQERGAELATHPFSPFQLFTHGHCLLNGRPSAPTRWGPLSFEAVAL